MRLYQLIMPLGIATLGMLVLTVISGLKRWKLKTHKTFAFLTLALGLAHAIVVVLANF